MSNVVNKLIPDLIGDNYVNAYVLHFFGINFYNYSDKTLRQVCEERGLNMENVVKKLEASALKSEEEKLELNIYSVDLIIEYLKHAHHLMIKNRLTYISKLIAGLEGDQDKLAADLKLIFPFFVEDFIRHIYHEEDTLFSYILTLNREVLRKSVSGSLYEAMEKHSIRDYALQHKGDDDMKGLRTFTNGYTYGDNLHLKVIMSELKAFDEELRIHARIEDEILFPKALNLEIEANQLVRNSIGKN